MAERRGDPLTTYLSPLAAVQASGREDLVDAILPSSPRTLRNSHTETVAVHGTEPVSITGRLRDALLATRAARMKLLTAK